MDAKRKTRGRRNKTNWQRWAVVLVLFASLSSVFLLLSQKKILHPVSKTAIAFFMKKMEWLRKQNNNAQTNKEKIAVKHKKNILAASKPPIHFEFYTALQNAQLDKQLDRMAEQETDMPVSKLKAAKMKTTTVSSIADADELENEIAKQLTKK